jgi:hypothetical protein
MIYPFKLIDKQTGNKLAMAQTKQSAKLQAEKFSHDKIVQIQNNNNLTLATYHKGLPICCLQK